MQINDQKVVTLDYTLTYDAGTKLDSTEGAGDFTYLHGASNIIPGLEQALEGKSVGDEFEVKIEPANGYGERLDDMIQTVPRDMFEGDMEIEVGMQFHAESGAGDMVAVTVTSMEENEITVDGNHPLAGIPLNFAVKVVDIREAVEEEIEHGHAHSGDGHHH